MRSRYFSPAGWRGFGRGPGLGRSDWSESRCTGPNGHIREERSCLHPGKDRAEARRCVAEVYLDLAWAFAQASLPIGSEHVDHLVQASLQGAKHLPCPLLFATVTGGSHVQRPRPEEQIKPDLQSFGETTTDLTIHPSFGSPPPAPPIHSM